MSTVLRRQYFRWEKIVLVEKELDGIDREGFGNLDDLLRLVLIHEECWNPKVVAAGRETIYKPVDIHPVTNAMGESISSISVCESVR